MLLLQYSNFSFPFSPDYQYTHIPTATRGLEKKDTNDMPG